ncbi:MAG: sialate O-acetylesterase [Pirellulales bacterium]
MKRIAPTLFLWLLACALPLAADEAPPRPLQVFLLAGQSNMEGQAVADLSGPNYNEGRGTLLALLNDPAKAPLIRHLRTADGRWTVRDDVWCRYRLERGVLLFGPLTVGFSVYGGPHHFGPELQFGQVLGDYCENPVLLIKTAWGGKSLYRDFRPPSAGGETGPYYKKMIAEVREALANLKTEIPSSGGRYELAGFVWYHGWNDGVDPQNAIPEYEQNLVHLINDVRREFAVPQLPVVIGELTGPWVQAPEEWERLRKAQAAAAARPEFAGRVRFVPTRDFVRRPADSPNPTHGHHEFGNAETYFLVGNALGQAMVQLLAARPEVAQPPASPPRAAPPSPAPPPAAPPTNKIQSDSPPPPSAQPTARVPRPLEGWTIRVDQRLLEDEPELHELLTRIWRSSDAPPQ